jgi:hypothetical protein
VYIQYKEYDQLWYLLKLWLKTLSGKVCDCRKLILDVKDTLSINSPPSPLPERVVCSMNCRSSIRQMIKYNLNLRGKKVK